MSFMGGVRTLPSEVFPADPEGQFFRVIQPRILRSINPVLSADAAFCEEALRIVSIMPKWKPGSQHGVNVKVRFTFPIGFASPTD